MATYQSMNKIYFASRMDTRIASDNPGFIEALKNQAQNHASVVPVKSPDHADIILIDEKYQYRTWHYTDELVKCSFVRNYADRIIVINHDSYARTFLPGLYVSLEASKKRLIECAPVPYKWDWWKVPVPESFSFNTSRLYTFRGALSTHPVRRRLCKSLSSSNGLCEELRKAFHSHTEGDQEGYIKDIQGARFSLCPRGLSPSSYRLYESMQLGRCPVIISDDWVPPPGPDWWAFSIFVRESDIHAVPEILSRMSGEAEAMGRLAWKEWMRWFSWPIRWQYFLNEVVRLHEARTTTMTFYELHDLWTSIEFKKNYGWTILGRSRQYVGRKIRQVLRRDPI